MGILGIKNRTENWKTAQSFAPYFSDGAARLELAKELGAPEEYSQADVRIELFWKGMRDHLHQIQGREKNNNKYDDKLANIYWKLFPSLRKQIEDSGLGLRLPQKWNYNPSKDDCAKLANNLVNTEIDIVLETPNQLFIGEAKWELGFHGNGNLVLVHQLVRQYVTAKILLELRGESKKKLVHFVVGDKDKVPSLKNTEQVKFMKQQVWLPECNVLSWEDIEQIAIGN